MSIAASFLKAPHWKQPNSPSTGEWIKILWYINTMGYISAIKRDKLLPHVALVNFKTVMLHAGSLLEKGDCTLNDSMYIKCKVMNRKYKLIYSDRKKLSGCLGRGRSHRRGRRERLQLACRIFRVMERFITLSVEMASLLYTYFKACQIG